MAVGQESKFISEAVPRGSIYLVRDRCVRAKAKSIGAGIEIRVTARFSSKSSKSGAKKLKYVRIDVGNVTAVYHFKKPRARARNSRKSSSRLETKD